MESEIWESENIDIKIEKLMQNLAESLKTIAKSEKDNHIKKALREILEEKRILN